APGQVTLAEAVEVYRARALRLSTVAIGYFGPAEHRDVLRAINQALSSQGCDAIAVPLGPVSAADGLAAIEELKLAGALVSPPLEERVAQLLPAHDAAIGRANVVLNRPSRLVAAWAPTLEAQVKLLTASLASGWAAESARPDQSLQQPAFHEPVEDDVGASQDEEGR